MKLGYRKDKKEKVMKMVDKKREREGENERKRGRAQRVTDSR